MTNGEALPGFTPGGCGAIHAGMRNVLFSCFLFLLVTGGCEADGRIRRAAELPGTTPWDLNALSRAPTFEWVDEGSPVRSLVYEGERYKGKPTKVFAYYATPGTLSGEPSSDKDLPGVVLVHGGGGTAFKEWAEMWAKRGYAAIAMDLRGERPNEGQNPHDPKNRTALPDGGPAQNDENIFFAIDQPVTEHWPYHAVAKVVQAHSLLRAMPRVDAGRTAITGISWGGYLTCIVAGLDSRFKAAVPVYGCGFLYENSAWLDQLGKLTPEQRARWVELYDPSRYLPACRVPIFFVNGTNDFAYPLDSYMKSYRLVPGEKNIRVTVNMPHGHQPGWAPKEIGMFVDQQLIGSDHLPKVHIPGLSRSDFAPVLKWPLDETLALVNTFTEITSASLHYTTDDSPINKRAWSSIAIPPPNSHSELVAHGISEDGRPTVVAGSPVKLEAVPGNATAWFLTVTDANGAVVSSEAVILEK